MSSPIPTSSDINQPLPVSAISHEPTENLGEWVFVEDHSRIFSEKILQLKLNNDIPMQLIRELKSIIEYVPSNYTLLYVDDGRLNYYTPKFMYGKYTHGNEVFDFIEKKIQVLIDAYENGERKHKWKILKVANLTLNGICAVIENYSSKNSYLSFCDLLTKVSIRLGEFIKNEISNLNENLSTFLKENVLSNVFQLLNFYAFSYPKDILYNLLSEKYGPRLVNEVFLDCHFKDEIPHESAFKLLFSIGTLVKTEDLQWFYENKKSSHKKSFDHLNEVEIQHLLNYFRKTPDGMNFLEYFEIPLTLDKFNIDLAFFEFHKADTLFEQNLINEMQVYCDIESHKLWRPSLQIQLSQLHMFDQLEKFLSDPFNPHLFHTDRYINFLTIASSLLAYLHVESEAANERFIPILEVLSELSDKADKIYPPAFVEKYRYVWNRLLGKIIKALDDPHYDISSYYQELKTHPLDTKDEQRFTLKWDDHVKPFEFLSRRIAYINRYYLESNFYLDETTKKLKSIDYLNKRAGTLFYMPIENEVALCKIEKVIFREGYVCQIVTHFNKNKSKIPIEILFQGTIENSFSINRDLYVQGAGYALWKEEGGKLFIQDLIKNFEEIQIQNNVSKNPTFIVNLMGHSLGGSDAQNAASFIGESLTTRKIHKKWIHKINLYTFNSAGIPAESIEKFNLNFRNYNHLIENISHTVVKHDVVSKFNVGKIGAYYEYEDKIKILEVSNLGLYYFMNNHCDYIFTSTINLLPKRLIEPKNNLHKEIFYKYLHGTSHSWTNLTSHLNDIKNSHPTTQIAYALLTIGITSFMFSQVGLWAEALILAGGSLSRGGVSMLKNAGDSYSLDAMRHAVIDLKDAVYKNWYGTQILEETDSLR